MISMIILKILCYNYQDIMIQLSRYYDTIIMIKLLTFQKIEKQ